MISARTKTRFTILLGLLAIVFVNTATAHSQISQALPNPVLYFTGAEYYQTGGKSFVRYRYAIDNHAAFPDSLFAPSPTLPPCGQNTRAARTWVDFYDSTGKRLYGFCALSGHKDLISIWFALEVDVIPPSWIYVEFNDRQTGTKYKSNLADTTL